MDSRFGWKALRRIIKKLLGATDPSVARGALGSFMLKSANVLCLLGISVGLARILGTNGFGVYTFVFSVLSIVLLPAQVGLPTLLTRGIASYAESGNWSEARGILGFAKRVSIVSVAVVATVAVLAYVSIGDQRTNGNVALCGFALVLLLLICLTSLYGSALQGLGFVIIGQSGDLFIRPALFLVFIGLAAALKRKVGADTAMGMHAFAALVSLLSVVILFARKRPPELRTAVTLTHSREWLRALMPLSLLAGTQVLSSQLDLVLLGIFRSKEEVGLYRIAAQCAALVAFALAAVNAALQPKIARLYTSRRGAELQGLVTWAARVALAVAVPSTLILVVFGKQILSFVFGHDFAAAHGCLSVLCLGQLVNAGAGSVGTILNMTGHERETMRGLAIASACSVALDVLLIGRLGALGVAIASTTGLILWNILLYFAVYRRLGLDSSIMGRRGAQGSFWAT